MWGFERKREGKELKCTQGCCAGTVKFQYHVNSVYLWQFQYISMPFHVPKSVQRNKFNRLMITSQISRN